LLKGIDFLCATLNATLPIPVIDLFAGPGGLGDDFSALRRAGLSFFQNWRTH
jgi:hypothetical protein